MKSINFDTQCEEYVINGDANRVIKINVRDTNIVERMEKALNKIDALKSELKDPDGINVIDKEIKSALDYAFNTNVSDIAFEGANCIMSKGGNGKTLLENFIDVFIPVVLADTKAALAADAISLKSVNNDITDEYIKSVEKIGGTKDTETPFVPYAKPTIDVNSLSESERKALLAQLLT